MNKIIKLQKKVTFETITEDFLIYKKQQIKESTYFNYTYKIQKYLLPVFKDLTLEEIAKYDFNKFSDDLLEEAHISNKFLKDILLVLKSILRYAERKYDIKMKLELINLPRVRMQNLKVFSTNDKRKIKAKCLNSNDTRDLGIILCLYTGMRIGEICALKWENIDLKEKNIYVKKTLQRVYDTENKKTKIIIDKPKTENSIRCIPLNSKIYGELNKIRKGFSEKDFFLTGADGIYIEPRVYQNYYKNMLKSSKVKEYNFHVLRHTFATNCIEVGMDIKSLSEILGHATVDITLNRYVHSSRKMKEKYLEKL